MTMPPFPTQPDRGDWWEAAMTLYTVPSWWTTPIQHADPLGRIAARARDIMRTRHTRTPAYGALLASQASDRQAAADAADAERARRDRARTAREQAEEAAFFADGGTALGWSINQEVTQQAKADNAKKRATSRMRAKARPTPKRTSATSTKETT